MGETPNMYPNLNDRQLRLNTINEVKDYFIAEIRERELMSKRLSKYIASFDYFDKSCFVCNKWWHIYCIICYCYWSTSRKTKCKF